MTNRPRRQHYLTRFEIGLYGAIVLLVLATLACIVAIFTGHPTAAAALAHGVRAAGLAILFIVVIYFSRQRAQR